jgi:hypothetical protein
MGKGPPGFYQFAEPEGEGDIPPHRHRPRTPSPERRVTPSKWQPGPTSSLGPHVTRGRRAPAHHALREAGAPAARVAPRHWPADHSPAARVSL